MILHAALAVVLAAPETNVELPAPPPIPAEWVTPLAAPPFRPVIGGGKNGFSYTYAEANYLWRDSDAAGQHIDGYELRGSFEIIFNLFLQASYARLTNDANLDEYGVGLGYHLPIGNTLDLYGTASYRKDDFSGGGSADADGGMLAAGARFWLTEKLELNGELQWANVHESAGGVEVGARWYLIDLLSLGGSYRHLDNDDSFAVGARVQF